ncbi:ATP-binding protein [Pseudoruegeria sp. SHC-113]|uniref:ATP-binding protein n=1 Tax=Pseudoruegeria sp. SHC-113 TaxID=2855439 RepID=UPI0021BA7DBF|nr:ATP-binding protein [Pseudoruegeria sp. SHC-113]MCT8160995.1 response regulator [Pseudoruegeria sp. SHC-113]
MAQTDSDPAELAKTKYSRQGRLQRFCRGRFATFPVRAGFELAGALIVAVFISPAWGVVAALALSASEVVELSLVRHVQRSGLILRNPRRASRVLTFGSGFWAVGVCWAIGILWFVGGPDVWVLCMAFLTAGLVNAQLVAMLHPPSIRAKITVLSGMCGVILGDSLLRPQADLRTYMVHFTAAVLLFTMLAGLFDRLKRQNESRHEAEKRLLSANAEGREMLAKLEASQAALVARAQEARELQRQAEAASVAKSEFLAVMSHEIRTPLNAVLGMADVLSESQLSSDQRDVVDTIESAGRALLSIINDVLDFSRIEAGKTELDAEPFALSAPLSDAARALAPLMAEKGLVFEANLAPAEGAVLVGDAGKLRQIVMNLLGNALKFTAEGSVSLKLAVARSGAKATKARVTVEVCDTGPGIPAGAIERIFEPFEQVDGQITRVHGGTGLGLAISRRLARKMNGDLTARSVEGKGSTFRLEVTLPLAEAAALAVLSPEATAPPTAGSLAGRRILAAEDNRANRLVLSRLLDGAGVDLTFAEDGLQAVESAGQGGFDLILMDMSMPHMDGIEATRRIRAAEAGSARAPVPIVALTANAFEQDRRNCLEAGMTGFLSKPLRKAVLMEEIAVQLSGAPSNEAADLALASGAPDPMAGAPAADPACPTAEREPPLGTHADPARDAV